LQNQGVLFFDPSQCALFKSAIIFLKIGGIHGNTHLSDRAPAYRLDVSPRAGRSRDNRCAFLLLYAVIDDAAVSVGGRREMTQRAIRNRHIAGRYLLLTPKSGSGSD